MRAVTCHVHRRITVRFRGGGGGRRHGSGRGDKCRPLGSEELAVRTAARSPPPVAGMAQVCRSTARDRREHCGCPLSAQRVIGTGRVLGHRDRGVRSLECRDLPGSGRGSGARRTQGAGIRRGRAGCLPRSAGSHGEEPGAGPGGGRRGRGCAYALPLLPAGLPILVVALATLAFGVASSRRSDEAAA